jgi:6-phosphogluconolactonase
MKPQLETVENAEALAAHGADWLIKALEGQSRPSVALAGGSTPKRLYELLASSPRSDRVAWDRVHWFFGDDRVVPPDDQRSNFRMANEALLSKAPIPRANIHPIPTVGVSSEEAARQYEAELRLFFGKDAASPAFDAVLLGMGPDGHTASLFPGTAALGERRAWAVANWVEKLGAWRVTLTAPAINRARHVAFVVTGAGKAERLAEILKGERDPTRLPSQLIEPAGGGLEWFVDKAAAASL